MDYTLIGSSTWEVDGESLVLRIPLRGDS